MVAVAQQMLSNGTKSLAEAIAKNNTVAIIAAQQMIQDAEKKLKEAHTHRNEQIKARITIGQKRKKQSNIMFNKLKKNKDK